MTTKVAGLPVGNVSVSGPDITVSFLLNNPRILDRRIGELANFNYWIDKILPNIGAPGGGVVIYEEWDPRFSMMDRDAEELAADAEVPLAGTVEGDVKIARAKIDGLGYTVGRTQEKRNQRFVIDRKERALANSIADRFNSRGVAAMLAAISAASRTQAATDWSALVVDGANPDPRDEWPHSTIALLNAEQTEDRIPFKYDGMLVHSLDLWRLHTIYDKDGSGSLESKLGLSTIIEDNTGDIERGKPILFSSGNVGGTAWEEPVQTEVIPEPRRRRKVVQSTGSAAYFVDNPYGLLQLTGVADADLTP